MDEQTLRTIIANRMKAAAGSTVSIDSELSQDREKALKYYRGEPFGDEVEGRSQVVMTDVADVIEWVLPGLLEPFTAGDEMVNYEPLGPEDEAFAKQATDYGNHIVYNDNPGFQIFHTWFKDALLQKLGVVKVWWGEVERTSKATYTGLTDEQLMLLLQGDGDEEELEVYATEHEATVNADGMTLHEVTIERKWEEGRVHIAPVPPDDFLFSARAVSQKDALILGERTRKTRSELISMGYDRDRVMAIPPFEEADLTTERQTRYDETDDGLGAKMDEPDPASIEVMVCELYLRVDYDDDGIAELRKVTCGGGDAEIILDNEEVDDDPYCLLTPIPMPHTIVGRSIADQVMDIQRINSTLMRQVLDNMYQANNARTAVSNKVDLDDILSNRVGGIVRVDTDAPDVAGHTVPMVTQPLGQFAFPVIEFMQQVRENRTGVTRYNQGIDANSLNKTATGVQAIMGASQSRQHMIARNFAETGVKDLFRKILHIVVKHQDRPRVIRLRNEWVDMDPRQWNAEMDVKVTVGLGYGSKDQQAQMIGALLTLQEKVVTLQGGVQGPLVTAENIYNALAKFTTGPAGFRTAEPFWTDPKAAQQMPQQPKPDPLMMEVQGRLQLQHEATQAKLQMDAQKAQLDMQTEQAKAAQTIQIEQFKAELEAQTKIRIAELELAAKREIALMTENIKAQAGAYNPPMMTGV